MEITRALKLTALIMVVTAISGLAQEKRDVTITLIVTDPANITQETVEKLTEMTDDNPETSGASVAKNYQADIFSDRTVKWEGKTKTSSDYEVTINEIRQVNRGTSRRLLRCRTVVINCRKFRGNNRVRIRGRRHRDGIQSYLIDFTLKKPGEDPKRLILDPKLKMRF